MEETKKIQECRKGRKVGRKDKKGYKGKARLTWPLYRHNRIESHSLLSRRVAFPTPGEERETK
jgi:hypothetical protein